MGIPDSSLLDLIEKVISWITWGSSDMDSVSGVFDSEFDVCCNCEVNISKSCLKYHCQKCGSLLCNNCVQDHASLDVITSRYIKSCKFCFKLGSINSNVQRCLSKVCPIETPGESPKTLSPSVTGERFDARFPNAQDESFSDHPSPGPVSYSPSRSDEDEGEDATSHVLSPSSKYLQDTSDVDSVCGSARTEFYSFSSFGSTPTDSPSRIRFTSNRVGHHVKQEPGGTPRGHFYQEQAVLEKPAKRIDDQSTVQSKAEQWLKPEDTETSSFIWFPPPPLNLADEVEDKFTTYDDDDDEVGISGAFFSEEKQCVNTMDPLRAAVQGHFKALVLQLLHGQGITLGDERFSDWLDIITTIAWQAASFIKPDTGGGGSMNPCDYVKVKCVASGSPSQSKLIKGIVCTKNIKHKRMTSQYKNTRLLLLGGALECQRDPNQLASFEKLLQQENDSLRTIVSKIEALRPNVLLVEKSASSFAQDLLLAKEISLVLNVKKPLLERIARCSGAIVTPSTDYLSTARLGHCELFHLEKIVEDHEPINQFNKRPSKTLMFFEGCPRRLGCTVVLRGSTREELKRVKSVVQYAVFAAYHLSLETSFIIDEGARLPRLGSKFSPSSSYKEVTAPLINAGSADLNLEIGLQESLSELGEVIYDDVSTPDEFRHRKALSDACDENLALHSLHDDTTGTSPRIRTGAPIERQGHVEGHLGVSEQQADDGDEASSRYYSANDTTQSILVSFSSHCIPNETVCERSRLLRIKFYGSSDKPLGRYLRDDLFDKTSHCRSCKESAEAHAICYSHQHGNLMINVRCLPSVHLPGEDDGKIWMWHLCLRCTHTGGVSPVTRRVVMSDAAWGLSFGKFLELSFSKHATGKRVASCGHSLQRDCLRFYGCGSMIACFRYSPINILSVRLPPSMLEFVGSVEQRWIRKEASELFDKAEVLYAEISNTLQDISSRSLSATDEFSDTSALHSHILELKDVLANERNYYKDLLRVVDEGVGDHEQEDIDILEINRLRHSLLVDLHVWDRRLYLLDSLLRESSSPKARSNVEMPSRLKDSEAFPKCRSLEELPDKTDFEELKLEPNVQDMYIISTGNQKEQDQSTSLERLPSAASILSDRIDSLWSGARTNTRLLDMLNMDVTEAMPVRKMNPKDGPAIRRLLSPTRVYSFDSAQRLQERIQKAMPPGHHLSTLRSFHASGDYKFMLRDPVSNIYRTYSQVSPQEAEKLNLASSTSPSFISYASLLPEGARLMVPQSSQHGIIVAVYDDEPTSIISYALCCKEHVDGIADKPVVQERGSNASIINKVNSLTSFGSLDLDHAHASEDGSHVAEPKSSPHLRVSFEDDSRTASGRAKFSVTCYFAKQFDALRRRCCPNELDFIRSMSRCRRWSAQGGKSNVYFAKTHDERFIIKQVTKTELESFEEFAPAYFKYFTDALSSGPTCLAKILGIYQVVVKYSKTGKETKMDLMVMENLFFNRNISKVYDLKGSERSRYNSDTTGSNKVLLDMNLLETMRTNPIFLESKAKRRLERAIWNDTSFLASIDVMDYSLLVGVDEEQKELVLGIIDYMRQYTWDKHLETWVKASGILGGPKNASPTIVSPKQYKRRFRKAMTTYFLTVPDQWSS